jgi:hypothetical protein
MTAPRLVWVRQADGSFAAVCGEEGQGRVRVFYQARAWEWWVDMLPADIEPKIRSALSCATYHEAMSQAELQVEHWPVVIEGARR